MLTGFGMGQHAQECVPQPLEPPATTLEPPVALPPAALEPPVADEPPGELLAPPVALVPPVAGAAGNPTNGRGQNKQCFKVSRGFHDFPASRFGRKSAMFGGNAPTSARNSVAGSVSRCIGTGSDAGLRFVLSRRYGKDWSRRAPAWGRRAVPEGKGSCTERRACRCVKGHPSRGNVRGRSNGSNPQPRWYWFALHPTGMLSVPRFTSWFLAKDRRKLRDDLARIAALPQLCRVIPGHGQVVSEQASARLREAAERLS